MSPFGEGFSNLQNTVNEAGYFQDEFKTLLALLLVPLAVDALKLKKPILMEHSMGAHTVMRVGAEYPDLAKAVIMLDPLLGGARPGGSHRSKQLSL